MCYVIDYSALRNCEMDKSETCNSFLFALRRKVWKPEGPWTPVTILPPALVYTTCQTWIRIPDNVKITLLNCAQLQNFATALHVHVVLCKFSEMAHSVIGVRSQHDNAYA